ncbi:EamA family transporter [Nonomuraea jabiensis]|uniref:Drug/metabolite transporter (DMT)-like permease n=1 Tax=Nonomuraea jabiensis TaxID=882448 RepID=A0A7W9G8R3_9ACTN|nr:EamA family transporter [Nonomuraea jabiensis]MBB5779283.1 drug/metabolite transporter (DMT)-like permease [Nonomuraea jabiensis]
MPAAILLALAAAALYGASDFLGGLLSRRRHYALVGLVGQAAAAIGGLAAALAVSARPEPGAIGWGIGAGLGGAVGTLALYRGLSRGRMNVAGPLSAVGAAGLPIPIDLLSGGEFTSLAVVGVGLAIPGIWLVAAQPGRRGGGGVVEGLLAGLGFAALFVCLDRAGDTAGLWPVAASQLSAVAVLAVFVLAGRRGAARTVDRPAGAARVPWAAVWPGVLGVCSTVLYALSTREATLAVSAVITSLYPAFTVALAALVLRERTSLAHAAGLLLCAASVGAFAAG